ncbi:MAG: hypothetical protein OXC68_14605 [Aestuariivita sp.]|nr:hypothetical protein [Aestuariivita sp.]
MKIARSPTRKGLYLATDGEPGRLEDRPSRFRFRSTVDQFAQPSDVFVALFLAVFSVELPVVHQPDLPHRQLRTSCGVRGLIEKHPVLPLSITVFVGV